MSLIDSSYFIGERNIPNTSYPDVSSLIDTLIQVHEKEYLTQALGYELFLLFDAALQSGTPAQRFLDLLLGKDFTGQDGRKKRWRGLVTITDSTTSLVVSSAGNDIFFTVGTTGAPANGDDTYINEFLAGKTYRVIQRGFGPLEQLKEDDSNAATADIQINPSGGFSWLGGTKFSQNDKYLIQLNASAINVSGVPIVPSPESPIADYVYYWYMRHKASNTGDVGEVRSDTENADKVSPKMKQQKAWNDMVHKSRILNEFLRVNYQVYPECQVDLGWSDRFILQTINAFGI